MKKIFLTVVLCLVFLISCSSINKVEEFKIFIPGNEYYESTYFTYIDSEKVNIKGNLKLKDKYDVEIDIYADVYNGKNARIDQIHFIEKNNFNVKYSKEGKGKISIPTKEILVTISRNGKIIGTNDEKLFHFKMKSSDDEKRCKCRDFKENYEK